MHLPAPLSGRHSGIGENIPVVDGAGGLRRLAVAGVGDVELGPLNRSLGGTSGTGGTVIGQKVTGKNGTAIWTGLQSGTYVVEEVDPADGYSIINASETVFLG